MDIKTDEYRTSMAELAQQGRALAKEIDEFLNGDNSHMSEEEYHKTQKILFYKQQHAIEALASAMGMNQQPTTLMQSEDMTNLKRLAGITENVERHNYDQMKKIVQLATNYMQNESADATMTAKNIIFLAQRVKGN
jgi:hypothetical protein